MINIKDATAYTVEYMDKEDLVYNSKKIGNLLIIASIVYACNPHNPGKKLFNDEIISLDTGAYIKNLNLLVLNPNDLPVNYVLDDQTKGLLDYVFRYFGSLPNMVIDQYIDIYKPNGMKMYDIMNMSMYSLKVLPSPTLRQMADLGMKDLRTHIKNYWKSVDTVL